MTEVEMKERIEELEGECEELRKMLKEVAKIAYFAYNEMKFGRWDETENLVYEFIRKG